VITHDNGFFLIGEKIAGTFVSGHGNLLFGYLGLCGFRTGLSCHVFIHFLMKQELSTLLETCQGGRIKKPTLFCLKNMIK
jgi:hypothetical protein